MRKALLLVVLCLATEVARGTTIAVPSDRELIARSEWIVTGSVERSTRTSATVRVADVLKGSAGRGATVDVALLEGVDGSPRFAVGERVLLFLRSATNGRWAVTDLAVGKFTFQRDATGGELLLRENSDLGFRDQRPSAATFLAFVRSTAQSGPAAKLISNVAIPPSFFTSDEGSGRGSRWTTFPAPVAFNVISNSFDEAEASIIRGIHGWSTDPRSNVNLIEDPYSAPTGQTGALGTPDGFNTIRFEVNLTGNGIAAYDCVNGGVLALTRKVFGTDHTFQTETYRTITEVDIDGNQGVNGCGWAIEKRATMIAHEVGHALGFRNSNRNRTDSGACDGTNISPCSTTAVMTEPLLDGLNGVLQQWDRDAVHALYPGWMNGDFNGDQNADIVWRNYSTGGNAVWHMDGSTYLTSTALPAVHDLNWRIEGTGDFSGDGRPDILWRNYATGANAYWEMNGTVYVTSVSLPSATPLTWRIVGTGDFNRDGKTDIAWRNTANSQNACWLIGDNGAFLNAFLFPADQPSEAGRRIAAVGDYSGDGQADLVGQNGNSLGGEAIGPNGSLLFRFAFRAGAQLANIGAGWNVVATADMNDDGWLDFIFRNQNTGGNAYWGLQGTEIISSPALPGVTDQNWEIVGPR